MNERELNIKIADHVGTGHLRWVWFFEFRVLGEGEWYTYTCGTDKEKAEQTRREFMEMRDQVTELDRREVIERIPDYGSDLNAMHEAEKTLTDDQHVLFRMWLYKITFNGETGTFRGPEHEKAYTSATASQRRQAFARVFNLV